MKEEFSYGSGNYETSLTAREDLLNGFRGVDSKDRWAEVDRQLLRLRNLGDDWDGDGAVGPDPLLIDSARALLASLRRSGTPIPSRIVATVNGTVSFEWYSGGAMTQLEVIDIGMAEQMVLDPTQSTNTSSLFTW